MHVHLVCNGCAVRGPRSVIGALTLPQFDKGKSEDINM